MTISFLDALQAAAEEASRAETAFRRSATARIAALEQERAFAFRRANFMRAIAATVAGAEDAPAAVAEAAAALRARLGWASDSDAREAVVARFAPVAETLFRAQDRGEERTAADDDVGAALAAFETWYGETHTQPFWVLFEQPMPETPLVDF